LFLIKNHYKKKVSLKFAISFVDGIIDETIGLEKNPYIGQVEPTLAKKSQTFRYLIYKNYKIIYWINEKKNRIDIANVFDTRQDPAIIEQTE
ncbi:MAG TPA: type II toxin-antitoxin system RelE/ParE family toxin, partial [Gillisia sp.]|nr:type II toxin-antitoxin system RelE/ParE family toxin [Gillisia sp.]